MKRKRFWKRLAWFTGVFFLLLNLFCAWHAWKFTHFTDTTAPRTNPNRLSALGKLKTVVLGVDNPRPANNGVPPVPYETITLRSDFPLEAWLVRAPRAKGTVVLFHGYSGKKSSMTDRAMILREMGVNTLLVDFRGSGGSGGNYTTVGFQEARDVKAAYDYLRNSGERNIWLLGSSLGAAAVLKAVKDGGVAPKGIILEAPFATLYDATCARFRAVNAPEFPFAGLVVFWGGAIHGFWGFGHQPREDARAAKMPALVVYGEKDERVERWEIDAVFDNLGGRKELVTFPGAGHVNFLSRYRAEWTAALREFILME